MCVCVSSHWTSCPSQCARLVVCPATSLTTDSRTYTPVSSGSAPVISVLMSVCVDDETRVQLKGDSATEGSDYINASFIDVSTYHIDSSYSVPMSDYYRDTPTRAMPTLPHKV